jgi:hypothetical protein
MGNDDAAGPDMAGRPTQRLDRIGEITQNQPPDDRVEDALDAFKRLHVANDELDVRDARRGRPLTGVGDRLGIALDADDTTMRANTTTRQQGDVPGAGSEVQHAHTRPQPSRPKDALRERVE